MSNKKNKNVLDNFPFEYNGKTYWYSRSMTGVMFAYCWNNVKNEWCVLADKRGTGCPSNVGRWNVPCGYLSHNEALSVVWHKHSDGFDIDSPQNFGCARRECFEETGVIIPAKYMRFYHLNSKPYGEKQNVDCKFYAILPGDVTDYPTTDKYSEPDEVADIKWIPMSELHNYKFAFNQIPMIEDIYNRYVNISWFRKQMIKLTEWMNKKFSNPKLV